MLRSVHAKAPLRLGLAGGGTDVAPFSDLYGGYVLNATISMYAHCHISVSDSETNFHAADSDIKVNFTSQLASKCLPLHYGVHKKIYQKFNIPKKIKITVTTYSDAPPGSGVGSSSALVVALAKAYAEFFQIPLGEYDLAQLAFEIERVDCCFSGGKQDQYASAFGGFNFMEFSSNNRVIVNPLRLKSQIINELETSLLLYYTGRSRSSAEIIDQQILASQTSSQTLEALHSLKQDAIEMKESLLLGRIDAVLSLLGRSWKSKKKLADKITNTYIDEITQKLQTSGALGFKISGAGGGGFMMIAVDPESRHRVVDTLKSFEGRIYSFVFVNEGAESW